MPLVETPHVHAERLTSASGSSSAHLVRDGEAHFQEAQLAMVASDPTAAQGRQP